jgi:hypothetical protein
MRRTTIFIEAPSPELQVWFWEVNFGPVVMAKAAIGEERWPAARDGILAMLNEINERDDGTMAAEYGYLETIGHKPEA